MATEEAAVMDPPEVDEAPYNPLYSEATKGSEVMIVVGVLVVTLVPAICSRSCGRINPWPYRM